MLIYATIPPGKAVIGQASLLKKVLDANGFIMPRFDAPFPADYRWPVPCAEKDVP